MGVLQVLCASDADADEEGLGPPTPSSRTSSQGTGIQRRTGSMATMSGADDVVYMEYSTSKSQRPVHPLFRLRQK